MRSFLRVGILHFRWILATRWIENVKFNKRVVGVSADGLVVMTWAFQAEGSRSKPKTRVRIPVGASLFIGNRVSTSYDEILFVSFIF